MTTSINRRTAMLALASTGAIASTSAATLVDVNAAEAAAWESALRDYTEAKAAYDAYQPTCDRAYQVWSASRPSMDTIHWQAFTFRDRDHVARTMDLKKEWTRYLDGYGKWWFSPHPELPKVRFRAALDSVAAFRKAEHEHNISSGMAEADATTERLDDVVSKAEDALLAMPAPHGQALHWKLDFLFGADSRDGEGFGSAWCAKRLDALLADANRLLVTGRA